MSNAKKAPQPGNRGASEKRDATNVTSQDTASDAVFVGSAAGNAGRLSFEEIFGGQHLDDVELPDPCRTLTLSLCGGVLDDLEDWAECSHMTPSDLVGALIVQGLGRAS
ncbi:hypothetical protein [Streptomyces sp. NPDC005374]|uniref:hypothetical protein n=1 Tax=Streptomyces sp. NPDC005374 TaxID=3364713 RepID=UPI0036ABD0D0